MKQISQIKNVSGMAIEEEGMVIDLVCGMDIDPKQANFKSTYQDKQYYFCYDGCKTHFDNDPEKYAEE
ncbi:MAG: YHS domain-containing protein [bacterium]|nr:YHS domain-containing protein [bacterium]